MKVLMLNGSCNVNGSTKAGLDIMTNVFNENGIESEVICIGGRAIHDCMGCGKCAELKKCIFDDDSVNEFVAKTFTADGFVFGTPVYYAHPSGRVLSFLDRVFFSSRLAHEYEGLKFKPAATIVVARRAGTSASYDVMNKYMGISNMLAVGSTYWNLFHASKKDDVPHDLEGVQTLQNLALNVIWLMRCLKAGKDAGISLPAIKEGIFTNFVR